MAPVEFLTGFDKYIYRGKVNKIFYIQINQKNLSSLSFKKHKTFPLTKSGLNNENKMNALKYISR